MPARSLYVDQNDRAAAVAELKEKGFLRNFEARLKQNDGKVIWTSISVTIVNYGGVNSNFAGFTDITERKEAEGKLTENAAIMQTILDTIPISLSLRDMEGRIQFFNKFGAAYYEKSPSDFMGKTLEQAVSPAMGTTIEPLIQQVIDTQEPILDLEYHPGRLSGTTMNLNLVPVFDNNGEMVGTLASSADITARKAADDQLRLSEANFRNLVENSIQGVCVDLEGRFLFANQAMADIFSYESPLDILNLSTAEDLIAPDEVGRIKEYTRQRLARLAAPNRYRTQGVRRDGTPVWLEIMADVVIWDGADAVMATVVDITAEVHAEAGREQLADALNHFPEPVVLFDKEDRLIFRNDAYLRDLQLVSDYDPMGQTFEAIMRRRAADGYFPEAKGRTEEWLLGRLAQHREQSGPVRVRRKRDQEVWLDLYDVATPDGGSLTLFVDVTELRHQEGQLRQAQKMEPIGQLTGGITHDFNNILAIIKGNLDLIEAQVEDDSDLIEILSPALQATDWGADLTHRLLAFARQQPLNISPINIPDLLNNMDGMLRSSLGETIDVQCTYQADLWPCNIDPAQLEQAILNLAVNARDAMTNGGRLTIAASNEQISKVRTYPQGALVPGAYVLLTVTDTGAGMAPIIAERAFDPFFTTKEVGQGTGLGLSMVFGFVKQSGGHISVESAAGAGTTF